MRAASVVVTGRVQGVFFRATAEEKANELGVKGWVRNSENGAVEIHAEGEEAALEQFIAWCHEGPPAAEVIHVEVRETEEKGFAAFERR